MATPVPMPALSPTMKEGVITRWLKHEGDSVSSGDAIAECETDKANLEIESYEDGVLLKVLVQEGEAAPVGAPIAIIGAKGEKVELPATQGGQPPAPAPADEAAPAVSSPAPTAPAQAGKVLPMRKDEPSADGRVRASPLAKRMAQEQGLDLHHLRGSGPGGRIIKRDIEQAMAQPLAPPGAAFPGRTLERVEPTVTPFSSMRRVIAERLTEAKPGVPHFYLTVVIEMDQALLIREEAKSLEAKVSVNDIVVKAAAMAVRRFPKINVQYSEAGLRQLHNVDVGVAVAIDDGLLTPVLRDADQKGLAQISAEVRDLAERAKKRRVKPEEYTGGSITVSNLGMYGIESFVAVINPPQAAILAVGSVTPTPVVRDGEVVVRQMMSVTLSGDHRVIDGALGAQYLKELKGLLEHPMRLLF